MVNKNINNILLSVLIISTLTSCNTSTRQTMKASPLIIWTTEVEKTIIDDVVKEWNETHVENQQFEVSYVFLNESETAQKLINDDIDDDDMPSLYLSSSRYLPDLIFNNKVEETKGDKKDNIVNSMSNDTILNSTINEKLYGYPLSNDDSYFLWYNESFYNEQNISSLEDLLSIAKSNGKQVYLDVTDGYYLGSFFMSPNACGLNSISWKEEIINKKDNENISEIVYDTTWDSQMGINVATYLANLLSSYYESNTLLVGKIDDLVDKIKENDVIAAFFDNSIENQLTNELNIKASCLPYYHIDGEAYQMASFVSSYAYYVNKEILAKDIVAASTLAELLISKEVQLKRYELSLQIPSNKEALLDSKYLNNIPMSSNILEKQKSYSVISCNTIENRYFEVSKYIGSALIENDLKDNSMEEFLKMYMDTLRNPVEHEK